MAWRKRKLQELIEDGEMNLNTFCVRLGYKPRGLGIATGKYKIELPPVVKAQIRAQLRIPRRDALIALGLPSREIAELEDISRAGIYQYIKHSGQQEFYRQQREVVIKTIGHRSTRVGIITPTLFQQTMVDYLDQWITARCKEEGFAYEKAWKFYQGRTPKTFPELVELFDRYHDAKERGVKLSLRELGKPLGCYPASVGEILAKVNLPPLYGSWNIPARAQLAEKKRRIRSCFDLPLSVADLAHFSDISLESVRPYFQSEGKRHQSGGIERFRAPGFSRGMEAVLTYRRASEIFEADDAGFSLEEICEYAATKQKVVEYAREHRAEIEKPIIKALQRLYPGEEIIMPYRYAYGLKLS